MGILQEVKQKQFFTKPIQIVFLESIVFTPALSTWGSKTMSQVYLKVLRTQKQTKQRYLIWIFDIREIRKYKT